MPPASLLEVPDGTAVFIDANIFIYHLSGPSPLSPACSTFLERVETGLLRGLTSSVVVIEVLHRLMILEAVTAFGVQARTATRYLKEHPEHVRSLRRHQEAPARIRDMGIELAPVGLEEIERSHEVKRRYGLLTNDALVVAAMQASDVTALASNDPDFARVEGITLYRPAPSG